MNSVKIQNKLNLGAQLTKDNQVSFKIYAPDAKSVDLILNNNPNSIIPMERDEIGVYSVITDKAGVGSLYQFRIDNDLLVPDPLSNFQKEDVHGSSVVIDHSRYDWENDGNWKGRPFEETVIYELHVGTFTPEGTYKAAVEKLDYLVELGITAIELMPLADFPGKRNWGYDGVLMYAPETSYGSPDDLKNLIKAAHKRGLMVFLDVVYNHFGPDGNYLYVYAKSGFFNIKKKNPWGDSIDFSNPIVRNFYINNVIYWLENYHFDGLRFDAVQEIKDSSELHILSEISQNVKEKFKNSRHIHLMLENGNNESHYYRNKEYSAQWNDDFHHAVHVALTGEEVDYYADYSPNITGLTSSHFMGKSTAEGFSYQGQKIFHRKTKPRGEISKDLPSTSFINFLQNHDQIGNRAFGERISHLVDTDYLKAAASLYLLMPSVPMLFMGEEWAASSPFLYFCDFDEKLSIAVREGRKKEFEGFHRSDFPDPTKKESFEKSVLNWAEINNDNHKEILSYYKNLLKIRREKIVPLIKHIDAQSQIRYNTLNDRAFEVTWVIKNNDISSIKVLANFDEESCVASVETPKKALYSTSSEAEDALVQSKVLLSKSVLLYLF